MTAPSHQVWRQDELIASDHSGHGHPSGPTGEVNYSICDFHRHQPSIQIAATRVRAFLTQRFNDSNSMRATSGPVALKTISGLLLTCGQTDRLSLTDSQTRQDATGPRMAFVVSRHCGPA